MRSTDVGFEHVRLLSAIGYAAFATFALPGLCSQALFSFVVRQPQMRPLTLLGVLADSVPTLYPDGQCVRDDRSDRERQQVSNLVIQRLEQRLHSLSRREAL